MSGRTLTPGSHMGRLRSRLINHICSHEQLISRHVSSMQSHWSPRYIHGESRSCCCLRCAQSKQPRHNRLAATTTRCTRAMHGMSTTDHIAFWDDTYVPTFSPGLAVQDAADRYYFPYLVPTFPTKIYDCGALTFSSFSEFL